MKQAWVALFPTPSFRSETGCFSWAIVPRMSELVAPGELAICPSPVLLQQELQWVGSSPLPLQVSKLQQLRLLGGHCPTSKLEVLEHVDPALGTAPLV